jgi:hypothetical protein
MNSTARAQHSEPNITLYGRIAADPVGYVSWPTPDLHFSSSTTPAAASL